MKRLVIFIASLMLIISSKAQKTYQWGGKTYTLQLGEEGKKIATLDKESVIDTSIFECIYYHLSSDPVLNESREEYDILLAGRKYAKYMNYEAFAFDSVLNYYDRDKITIEDYLLLSYQYPSRDYSYIIKESSGRNEIHDNVYINYFTYEDNNLAFGWALLNDTLTVCGHLCHMATCKFRGRDWTAWYAEDIPSNQGPWKFSGTPGMILQIEDSEREHVFRATSIRSGKSAIKLVHSLESKTNREWFNKALRDYMTDPTGTQQTSGVEVKVINGTDNRIRQRRRFFNPIEKE